MRDFITFCITVSPIQQTGLFITGMSITAHGSIMALGAGAT